MEKKYDGNLLITFIRDQEGMDVLLFAYTPQKAMV